MEKIQSRRSFIRTAGITAAVSAIGLGSWAKGLAKLYMAGINPGSEFSLLKIEKLLQEYQLPAEDNFTTDAFLLNYRLFNLYGNNAAPAGKMKWQLEPSGNQHLFRFTVERNAGNGITDQSKSFLYIAEGEATCKKDDTLTPVKWSVSKRISMNGAREGYLGTRQVSSGSFKDNRIVLKDGKRKITWETGSLPLSWKWGVMALVQNMSKNNQPEVRFSALDEFDALYADQSVKFVKDLPLDCDGSLRNFKIFLHSGDGLLPTVYWVDNYFRTVFVLTGMEAYILFP